MHTRRGTSAWLAALVLVGGGVACRSIPPGTATQTAPPPKITCFDASNITSFVPLKGHFLYVQVGTNEHYILTLDRPADTLRDAMHIQISHDYPRVCSNHRAPMTYEYQGHVGVYDIINVEPVRSQSEAEALAAERTPASAPQL